MHFGSITTRPLLVASLTLSLVSISLPVLTECRARTRMYSLTKSVCTSRSAAAARCGARSARTASSSGASRARTAAVASASSACKQLVRRLRFWAGGRATSKVMQGTCRKYTPGRPREGHFISQHSNVMSSSAASPSRLRLRDSGLGYMEVLRGFCRDKTRSA